MHRIFDIYKEDNHINMLLLGIKIKFRNPFFNTLEDCCSIFNLRDLRKRGVVFPHPIGIVIAKEAIIGNNCIIYQNVTIGKKNGLTAQKAPIIGDNVKIFAGASIVGEVKIGDNAVIGTNSVVLNDVPDNSICVGNPAKLIK